MRTFIKIYADGADIEAIRALDQKPWIAGFTTNPSLLKKAGVRNYLEFAKQAVETTNKPLSLEVLSDDSKEIWRQAKLLAALGSNVFVKVPIVNSNGERLLDTIGGLAADGIRLNVTCLMGITHCHLVRKMLRPDVPAIVSVFAGRIADNGGSPKKIMRACRNLLGEKHALLWASTREAYNVLQAERSGCDIITVPNDLLPKVQTLLAAREKIWDEDEAAKSVARQFLADAASSGLFL